MRGTIDSDLEALPLSALLGALYRHGVRALAIDTSGSVDLRIADNAQREDVPADLIAELERRRAAIMLLFRHGITRPNAADCARAEYETLPSRRVVYLCSAAGTTPVAAIMPMPAPPPPPPTTPPPAPPRRESWYSAAECDAWLIAHGWTRDEHGNWRSPRDS